MSRVVQVAKNLELTLGLVFLSLFRLYEKAICSSCLQRIGDYKIMISNKFGVYFLPSITKYLASKGGLNFKSKHAPKLAHTRFERTCYG